jgi:phage shock protein A
MGWFDRLKRIFVTNVNSALDSIEDKEAALDQAVRDMAAEHRKAKGYLAEAIVHLKKLERDVKKHTDSAESYLKKAKVILGDDDESNDYLAREALARKKEEEKVASQYLVAADNQRKAVEKLKANIAAMEKRIADARRKKQVLLSRKQIAESQEKIASMTSAQPSNEAFEAFNRLEEQIEDMATQAEVKMELTEDAGKDLDSKIEAIEYDTEVEDEFLMLKAEVSGLLPESTGGDDFDLDEGEPEEGEGATP